MRRLLLAALLGLLPASGAWAQGFEDALAAAYSSNPRLLAARARLRGVDEGVPQALSGWRPRVMIDTQNGIAIYDDRVDKLHRPEHRAPQDYALTVDQQVYTSGRVSAEVAQAKARVLSQRANLLAAESEVLQATATVYMDVVRDTEILALNRNELQILQRTLNASRVSFRAGAITEPDLNQVAARLAEQQATVAQLEAQLATASAVFEQYVGRPPQTVAVPTRTFPLPGELRQALAQANSNNPDVVAATFALEASKHGIDVARDALLPQVILHLLIERSRQTEIQRYAQRDNIAQGTVEVRIPLYQGGGEYSRVRQAKEQTTEASDIVANTRRIARQRVQSAWASLVAAQIRIGSQRAAANANNAAARGIALQQTVGARTVLDVLNAQQAALQNAVAQVSAAHDIVVSTVQVLEVTGALTAQSLHLPVSYYDPLTHFDAVHEQWIGTAPPRRVGEGSEQ